MQLWRPHQRLSNGLSFLDKVWRGRNGQRLGLAGQLLHLGGAQLLDIVVAWVSLHGAAAAALPLHVAARVSLPKVVVARSSADGRASICSLVSIFIFLIVPIFAAILVTISIPIRISISMPVSIVNHFIFRQLGQAGGRVLPGRIRRGRA